LIHLGQAGKLPINNVPQAPKLLCLNFCKVKNLNRVNIILKDSYSLTSQMQQRVQLVFPHRTKGRNWQLEVDLKERESLLAAQAKACHNL